MQRNKTKHQTLIDTPYFVVIITNWVKYLPALQVPLIFVKDVVHRQMDSVHTAWGSKQPDDVLALQMPPKYPSKERKNDNVYSFTIWQINIC